jgi:hypothetical protein
MAGTSIKINKMEILHTTKYDDLLKLRLRHLSNYPQMIPFIGANWDDMKMKILLIGESHFIPGEELNDIAGSTHLHDWYNSNSETFYEELANYLNTRREVNRADKKKEFGHVSSLQIHYSLKEAVKNELVELKDMDYIFPFLSYYNYFQRPAFIEGASILNNLQDDQIAYFTLKAIVDIIHPSKIIFCSKKAWNAYSGQLKSEDKSSVFKNILIDYVPHPATAHWNMARKSYGNLSGFEKFINILRDGSGNN